MVDYLPEWQIEEALTNNPALLEVPGQVEGLRLHARQRYLPKLGGYLDLLFRPKEPKGWLIVEVKANPIVDESPGRQVLEYKDVLSLELDTDPNNVHCMVAAPAPMSSDLADWYSKSHVSVRLLDLDQLLHSGRGGTTTRLVSREDGLMEHLARRRERTLRSAMGRTKPNARSIKQWVAEGTHDDKGSRQLATVLKWLSNNAPIFSHEIGRESERLETFNQQWFWLFYSSIDRRGNAALFVRAKEHLERRGLFHPRELMRLVAARGEKASLEQISHELTKAGVPLVVDLSVGRNSLARSILDSAKLVAEFDCDFNVMLEAFSRRESGIDTAYAAVKQLRHEIYGMGPRSAAQFVRGMTLKGPWRNLKLTHPIFLENTKYNALFAGPARLSIAHQDFQLEARAFADKYLAGDKGVLSHGLWYVRKRYCDKIPQCGECPMAGYCAYFREFGVAQRTSESKELRPRNENNLAQARLQNFL